MEPTFPQHDTSTPAGYPSRLAELNATLAELQARLSIVRGSLEAFEADKLDAIRAAGAEYAAAIRAANAEHVADCAPLIAIESELVAEIETAEAAAVQAELRGGR